MAKKNLLSLLLFVLIFSGCSSLNSLNPNYKKAPKVPEIDREFRAAWVATVANINWPSRPGLPVHQQKKEAIHLLDLLEDANYNAVIFQVRPQADALYESELEPWSYYLTGSQGEAPQPFYDPLDFWIEEAHKRNLELHVWMNPYRAHHISGGPISEHSVVKTKSDLVVPLVNGYWWFDPALKETQDHSLAVVMDIVNRYDIDGVHFDDYFYPYPSYNENLGFPDDKSWAAYLQAGGTLSRDDWRRKAVDDFIQRVYTSIKDEKPHVKFGLSPFGIWRPNHPKSIQGFDQYDQLYADAKKWLNKGWIDYFTPQLYWPVNQIPQSFPVLLGWWKEQNYRNRHLWPGMSLYRFEGEKKFDEVLNQIMITRGMISEAPGTVHWSILPLVNSDSLRQSIKEIPYSKEVLVPESPWLKAPKVRQEITIQQDAQVLNISHKIPSEKITSWVIYKNYGHGWSYEIIDRLTKEVEIPIVKAVDVKYGMSTTYKSVELLKKLYVTTIDRIGVESEPVIWEFKSGKEDFER